MTTAQQIISFALSDERRDSDAARVHLREHAWLQWNRLFVSPVMNVVDATAKTPEPDTVDSVNEAASLRDELCDLVDCLSSAGNTSPLTVVVRCDALTFAHWHRLAGDQDWLRGTFSIHPYESTRYGAAGFSDASLFMSFVTDSSADTVSQYTLRSLSELDYLDFVRMRIKEEVKESTLMYRLGTCVLEAYGEQGIGVAGQPLGQSRAARGVRRWLHYDVIAQANKLLMSDAPAFGTGEKE